VQPSEPVNAFIEERRREVHRLLEGALLHLGIREYSVSVTRRRHVNPYSLGTLIFAVKAEARRPIADEEVEFFSRCLLDRGYNAHRLKKKNGAVYMLI
jgi:hypothetical protein